MCLDTGICTILPRALAAIILPLTSPWCTQLQALLAERSASEADEVEADPAEPVGWWAEL